MHEDFVLENKHKYSLIHIANNLLYSRKFHNVHTTCTLMGQPRYSVQIRSYDTQTQV